MANFIEEVDEEVRRERMQKLFKRWSPLVFGVVIALLAGVAGYQIWHNHRMEKAAAAASAFDAALSKVQAGKPLDAAKAFADLAQTDDSGYALLARFQQAANLLEGKDVKGAIAALDAVAADNAVAARYRDLARYLAAFHGFDTLDAADLKQRLSAIPADSLWSANARELLALAELKAGETEAARRLLTTLSDDAMAPVNLRGRATELLAALGGPVQ
ncbi:MAG TPA: tetratricopeptide repeat protein [Ferrovibrio sp.]|uniref:tetratricopeptide repeat protein n=1 Tax=Ferrovibrio sp. TaxID=1917215 RepID=UPI002ED1CF47